MYWYMKHELHQLCIPSMESTSRFSRAHEARRIEPESRTRDVIHEKLAL